MQGLFSNSFIFAKHFVTIRVIVMKVGFDPTQRIQILIATGHPVHSSKQHTCRHFQNPTHALLTQIPNSHN